MNDELVTKNSLIFFDHRTIEDKWRKAWEQAKIDVADIIGKNDNEKYYNLMMFPYPSAEGLHVGNMYAFTGSDIFGRFKRMQGLEVFEPIGLDGFGIHSENYALKIGKHPMDQAKIAEKNYYDQLHRIGAMFDWTRTVETYDPEYYKWTQWLFIQMFKHGLAYRARAEVNWCPGDKTVLADEQVIDGRCERCGNLVEKKKLEQWFFRITAYAEKLLENLNSLNWSTVIKTAQKIWIGKKEGINITYPIVDENGKPFVIPSVVRNPKRNSKYEGDPSAKPQDDLPATVTCFTTRPDTNFGATFVVMAPEHSFITHILKVIKNEKGSTISRYLEDAKNRSKEERIAAGREKNGVFTGLFCLNQLNGYKMPLYISDFVVTGVGTDAVVGVPGHDKRDFEFAQKMKLPVIRVVVSSNGDISAITKLSQVQEEEGQMINSGFLDGLDIQAATKKMTDYLEEKDWGKPVTTYHLRDWLISRQRYWGPPIPMIYCSECALAGRSWFSTEEAGMLSKKLAVRSLKLDKEVGSGNLESQTSMPGWYPVPESELPVLLPRIPDYKPGDDGVAPLAKHKEFYETKCPGCGAKAVRETDVSDTFLDSSWYFLKYPSLNWTIENRRWKVGVEDRSSNMDKKNLPSNLNSQPLSSTLDPQPSVSFPWDPAITKIWLPVDMYTGGAEHSVLHLMYSRFVTMALHDWGYLDFEEPFTRFFAHGLIIKDGAKMSKSKGNVVNPDEYLDRYGADALRLYLMFMGPFSEGGDFRDSAMEGMNRWVNRVWRLGMKSLKSDKSDKSEIQIALNKLISKVTDDMEKRRYNTAIASMMEFTNLVADNGGILGLEELKTFVKLLAPFAPFIAEELWQRIATTEQDAVRGITFFAHPSVSESHSPSTTPKEEVTVLEKERPAASNSAFNSVHLESWPAFDPKAVVEETATVIVQVNGKLRTTLELQVAKSKIQAEVESLATASEQIKKHLEGKNIKKIIFVPGKLLNFVVS